MFATIAVTLPFFAVVGLGFLAAARGLLDDKAVGSLNVFVFYFAMPALVFLKLAQSPLESLLHPAFLFAWLCAALLTFFSCALLGRMMFGTSAGEAAVQGLASSFANTGFLGFPML
ncbi:MAG: AEC family transporter, partial [Rhodospirillales bacterium]|nr:AEC family transporter [Rhodospirillales bacterium]